MAQPGEFNISLYKGTLETVDISRNLANEKNVLSIRMLSGEYQTERKAEVRRGAKRQAEGGGMGVEKHGATDFHEKKHCTELTSRCSARDRLCVLFFLIKALSIIVDRDCIPAVLNSSFSIILYCEFNRPNLRTSRSQL